VLAAASSSAILWFVGAGLIHYGGWGLMTASIRRIGPARFASIAGVAPAIGALLAVAILTDALIVKMTLIPAFMTLMGEKTWYIPRWLDRLLPNITIEPPHEGDGAAEYGGERPAPASET